jgi:hypothetical protein
MIGAPRRPPLRAWNFLGDNMALSINNEGWDVVLNAAIRFARHSPGPEDAVMEAR